MYAAAAAALPFASIYLQRSISIFFTSALTEAEQTSSAILVGSPVARTWEECLRRALAELNRHLVLTTEATADEVSWAEHDLILIDAGAVGDLTRAISQIRARNPEARVIVFSSSPSWEQAREVMLAGAIDYAPKEFRHSNIVEVIRRGLGRPRVESGTLE